jgi:hypothetical protein
MTEILSTGCIQGVASVGCAEKAAEVDEVDRLTEKGVSLLPEGAFVGDAAQTGGNHDEPNRADGSTADATQHLKAVEIGQIVIADDDVGVELAETIEASLTGGGTPDLISLLHKETHEGLTSGGFILDHQHPSSAHRTCTPENHRASGRSPNAAGKRKRYAIDRGMASP